MSSDVKIPEGHTIGDHSMAEALRISYLWLEKAGWRYSPEDVGKRAKEILDAAAIRSLGEKI